MNSPRVFNPAKVSSVSKPLESSDKLDNYTLDKNPFSDDDNDQWEPDEEFNDMYITMDNDGNAIVHGPKNIINNFKQELFEKLKEAKIPGIPFDTNVIKIKQG